MNKNRLLSFLIPLIGSFSLITNQQVSVQAQTNLIKYNQIIAQQSDNFRELMDAGKENLQNGNYQQALFNFNSALELRPDDSEAVKAVNQARGYIYDSNMEKGYEATNNREYERALTYFRFASQQRPDDFYSQKAIQNVQKLIEKQANGELNSNSGIDGFVLFLIIVFSLLFIVIMISIYIGWRLLQANNQPRINPQNGNQLDNQTQSVSDTPESSNRNNLPANPNPPVTHSFETNETVTNKYSQPSDYPQPQHNPIPPQTVSNTQRQESPQLPLTQQTSPVTHQNPPSPQPVSSQNNLVPQNQQQRETAITTDQTQKLLAQLKSADRIQKGKIVWNLASHADSRAIQPLVNLMLSSNSQEKSLILEALAQIGFNSIKPINQALIIALQDQHGYVRKNALRDITKLYDLMLQIRPIITHATLNDPDLEVREIARWALTKFNEENNHLLTGQGNNNQGYEQEINATIIDDKFN